MTIDWLVGFIEGEGCFARRPGGAYYQFSLGQKDRRILDKIAVFLTEQGIPCKVYPSRTRTAFYINIQKRENARKLYNLIRPRMEHPGKIEQLEKKWFDVHETRPVRAESEWDRRGR